MIVCFNSLPLHKMCYIKKFTFLNLSVFSNYVLQVNWCTKLLICDDKRKKSSYKNLTSNKVISVFYIQKDIDESKSTWELWKLVHLDVCEFLILGKWIIPTESVSHAPLEEEKRQNKVYLCLECGFPCLGSGKMLNTFTSNQSLYPRCPLQSANVTSAISSIIYVFRMAKMIKKGISWEAAN